MKANRNNEARFSRLVFITIIAVYLLILAGGIVRSTGSGMGCPDWPKCFGSWIPPTSESELPVDYREEYAQLRVAKNDRLAEYLETFGFHPLADMLRAEAIAAPEERFNRNKTWIEYINRLLGVVVGFLITLMALASVRFRKTNSLLFFGSIGALILVIFQGWIGSIVVSTNLLPGMITFHMALAAALIGLLLYLFWLSSNRQQVTGASRKEIKRAKAVAIVAMSLFLIQIAIGTQVREAVDVIALKFGRSQWIENLTGVYYLHRTYSLVLLGLSGYLIVLLRQLSLSVFRNSTNLLAYFLIAAIGLGIVMAYFGMPAWAQPLHLLVGLLIVGVLVWILLNLNFRRT
jgi:cytochrome c oxidase assembly protein subunit 15